MEPFATVAELAKRLDWELSPEELDQAEGALDDASMLVRAHGKSWPTAAEAPHIAKTITLSAAKRYMANPDGYTQSRAGDETLAWDQQGENAGTVYLTAAEIKLLTRLVRPNALTSAVVVAYGPTKTLPTVGMVPTDATPFPYFADPVGPW
ncbi:hypothetical protein [Cellulomonas sp. SG140]|uniref:hypothetical protein n=1 Tax=Cellulomonas sp. SG140 TaxID=2976536 RepID=UPI0021E98CD7|nr:hypothetical protein [Cellulomonas sp. SG140]